MERTQQSASGTQHRSGETPLVLALDVGTSSCRASLYDATGRRVEGVGAQLSYAPQTTADGGAELDPDELVELAGRAIDAVATQAGRALRAVGAVATSTFWHSLVGVGQDGRAASPVYLWMDGRSCEAAKLLRERLDERAVHARTGCMLHSSYLPAKLLWLGQAEPQLCRNVRAWMSFGEYLALRFFGEARASVSMASGSGLFDHTTGDWDEELLATLALERDQFSPIDAQQQPFVGLRPDLAARWPVLRDVPWLPALGDGACSNVGAGCVARERMALMVGTSGALRVLWRGEATEIPWGVWRYRADSQRVLVGGALNDGGSLLTWLRRTLRVPALTTAETELAGLEPDGHGLTVLPFWAGERSPGWSENARGSIAGLRVHTTPVEILRAALEAVALRFARIDALLRRAVPEAEAVIATGGALLRSPAWMQIMADALGRPVLASTEAEGSSRGAALLAAESLGWLGDGVEALAPRVKRVYEPVPAHTERYRAAAERQERLYEAVVGDAGSRVLRGAWNGKRVGLSS